MRRGWRSWRAAAVEFPEIRDSVFGVRSHPLAWLRFPIGGMQQRHSFIKGGVSAKRRARWRMTGVRVLPTPSIESDVPKAQPRQGRDWRTPYRKRVLEALRWNFACVLVRRQAPHSTPLSCAQQPAIHREQVSISLPSVDDRALAKVRAALVQTRRWVKFESVNRRKRSRRCPRGRWRT